MNERHENEMYDERTENDIECTENLDIVYMFQIGCYSSYNMHIEFIYIFFIKTFWTDKSSKKMFFNARLVYAKYIIYHDYSRQDMCAEHT